MAVYGPIQVIFYNGSTAVIGTREKSRQEEESPKDVVSSFHQTHLSYAFQVFIIFFSFWTEKLRFSTVIVTAYAVLAHDSSTYLI